MTTMNYDYMPGIDEGAMIGFGADNTDLDAFLDLPNTEGTASHDLGNMYQFGGGLTPNGMNINGGLMTVPFGENMFQPRSIDGTLQFTNHGLSHYDSSSAGFPFPGEVNPAIIMTSAQPAYSGASRIISNGQQQTRSFAQAHGLGVPKTTQEPEEATPPKPKRTRQSKKKKLTAEQEEKKRKEFLERNRQAASKCRTRKAESISALQTRVQDTTFQNSQMKEVVAALKEEIADLSNRLLSHANCNDPQLKAAIEHYKLMAANGSVYGGNISPTMSNSSHSFGSMHEPSMVSPGASDVGVGILNSGPATPTWEMQRNGSDISQRSENPYNEDGTLNLFSSNVTNTMLREGSKKRKAADDKYMAELRKSNKQLADEHQFAMSRQNSKQGVMSRQSSKQSNSSSERSSRNNSSGNTSPITTPESFSKEKCNTEGGMVRGTRRGMVQKSLENPRTKQLIDPSLPGVSPLEFISQRS